MAKKDRRRSDMAEIFQEEDEARNEKESRRKKVKHWHGITLMTRSHLRSLIKIQV